MGCMTGGKPPEQILRPDHPRAPMRLCTRTALGVATPAGGPGLPRNACLYLLTLHELLPELPGPPQQRSCPTVHTRLGHPWRRPLGDGCPNPHGQSEAPFPRDPPGLWCFQIKVQPRS